MLTLLKRFNRQTDAQDIIEYALLAALLSVCAVMALQSIGTNVVGVFDGVNAQVAVAGGPSATPTGGGSPGGSEPGTGSGPTGSNGGTPDSGNGGGNTGGNGNSNGSTGGTGPGK